MTHKPQTVECSVSCDKCDDEGCPKYVVGDDLLRRVRRNYAMVYDAECPYSDDVICNVIQGSELPAALAAAQRERDKARDGLKRHQLTISAICGHCPQRGNCEGCVLAAKCAPFAMCVKAPDIVCQWPGQPSVYEQNACMLKATTISICDDCDRGPWTHNSAGINWRVVAQRAIKQTRHWAKRALGLEKERDEAIKQRDEAMCKVVDAVMDGSFQAIKLQQAISSTPTHAEQVWQAMRDVCEAAKVAVSLTPSDGGFGNGMYKLRKAVDALAKLDALKGGDPK